MSGEDKIIAWFLVTIGVSVVIALLIAAYFGK